MKSVLKFIFCAIFAFFGAISPTNAVAHAETKPTPKLAIIIDDFGGYERGGVDEMLAIDAPLTCAVMPGCENTQIDAKRAIECGKEVIVHMPMQAHVNLPESWYGTTFIKNYDTPADACLKLDNAFAELPMAKGFNIHIGSGVSQNETLMTAIIDHLNNKGLYFCDSRTILNSACEKACLTCKTAYLGRDVFLEPHGQGGYANACKFLLEGAQIALEKGHAIAIGHVGVEGGINTARAIADTLAEIKKMGVEIVPVSEIASDLKTQV